MSSRRVRARLYELDNRRAFKGRLPPLPVKARPLSIGELRAHPCVDDAATDELYRRVGVCRYAAVRALYALRGENLDKPVTSWEPHPRRRNKKVRLEVRESEKSLDGVAAAYAALSWDRGGLEFMTQNIRCGRGRSLCSVPLSDTKRYMSTIEMVVAKVEAIRDNGRT
ncbi:hypothetical protein KIN20_029587 [Parelaphostrongylus tenuis]|uniref:Uncharacterized protein n=1 Tax=Parelaphostrongylus tenuis TaxID=148309 RepID=A0AAD5R2X0_PARTN|nr:hypothetical protein KIN20_029587 [Parelaphostrongylus tenuis]